MEPSGSLWPNGEFTVGYAACGGAEREMTPSEYAQKWDSPLGLALPANSHREVDFGAAPRGTKGLTSYGRRLVRNSVEMLERVYGATNLSFVTLTLPDLEYEEYWNVSSNWGQIVRVYYQAIGRCLSRSCLPPWYVGVTELQPERTTREQVPALHIHFVCVGRRRGEKGWRIPPCVFRNQWKKAVQKYCWNEYNWDACERVEGIRHTASGYLSKYMSKGMEGEILLRREGTGWSLPTAWYNISLRIKQAVKKRIRQHPELMEQIEALALSGAIEAHCEYFHAGEIPEMAGTGPHYFIGKLKRDFMEEIKRIWRENHIRGG